MVDRQRTALLAAVGHDLRTPLAGIKASVTTLRQTDVDWSQQERDELLETIEESADRLDSIVANLLDASRLQAGAVSVRSEPVALDEVIGAAVLAVPGAAERVTVDVPEDLPLVQADADLLERVLANLLDNAVRHGADRGEIEVSAIAGAESAKLKVVDHGPGVPPDQREGHVRAVPATRRQRRSRRRPRADGRTRIHGSDGRCSHRGRVIRRRIDHAASTAAREMTRVLIVEDEPGLRKALAINLRARKYDVTAAADGRAALAGAARKPPDVVVLDLGLPDMDGTEVIEGLRGWSQAPIIVLSARDEQDDKVIALDAGADDYMTKPFGMDELLARLRAALRRSGRDPEAPVVKTASFSIDLGAKQARTNAGSVHLTPTEWHLLEVLIRHEGKLVSRQQLLHEVWGPAYETETNYLRVYMAQLRRKLEPEPAHPRHLITEPGMGYRFVSA